MHRTHLEGVDLNLLPALAALLDERHISRAAERTGLSQSAMSRALQRLRRVLGDDLLVRDAGGYRLTPRAERLRDQVGAVVPRLGEIFLGERFDPAAVSHDIEIGGSDYTVAVLGIPLTRRLLAESPRSSVRFRAWHESSFQDLGLGGLNLIFFGAQVPAPLHSMAVLEDRFVCVLPTGHPLAGATAVDLPSYLACRHMAIDITDGAQPAVDRILAGYGTPRDVGAAIPFHAIAPHALLGTDLVLTYPERLVGLFAGLPGLTVVPAPPEIGAMTYRMAWHPRLDSDPAHRWLRDAVRDVALEV